MKNLRKWTYLYEQRNIKSSQIFKRTLSFVITVKNEWILNKILQIIWYNKTKSETNKYFSHIWHSFFVFLIDVVYKRFINYQYKAACCRWRKYTASFYIMLTIVHFIKCDIVLLHWFNFWITIRHMLYLYVLICFGIWLTYLVFLMFIITSLFTKIVKVREMVLM